MDKFDRLNRETREYNARNVYRNNSNANSAPKYGSADYWHNYWNNQTYKSNNGEYSRKYY